MLYLIFIGSGLDFDNDPSFSPLIERGRVVIAHQHTSIRNRAAQAIGPQQLRIAPRGEAMEAIHKL